MSVSRFIAALGCALLAMTATAQAQDTPAESALPMTNSSSVAAAKPFTIAQQRAQFAADQRMFRIEFNNAIGYSPLRPSVSAGYMSYAPQRYFINSRQTIVSPGTYSWYW